MNIITLRMVIRLDSLYLRVYRAEGGGKIIFWKESKTLHFYLELTQMNFHLFFVLLQC